MNRIVVKYKLRILIIPNVSTIETNTNTVSDTNTDIFINVDAQQTEKKKLKLNMIFYKNNFSFHACIRTF
jgi:hypothetical protein